MHDNDNDSDSDNDNDDNSNNSIRLAHKTGTSYPRARSIVTI